MTADKLTPEQMAEAVKMATWFTTGHDDHLRSPAWNIARALLQAVAERDETRVLYEDRKRAAEVAVELLYKALAERDAAYERGRAEAHDAIAVQFDRLGCIEAAKTVRDLKSPASAPNNVVEIAPGGSPAPLPNLGGMADGSDPNITLNMRGWLEKVCKAAGATITGKGFGSGPVADLDLVIEGSNFNVEIRPLLKTASAPAEKEKTS